jgi:hypothetical protein
MAETTAMVTSSSKAKKVCQVTLELIRDLNYWRERAAETRAKADSYRASSE